jgi:hypothetical protein
MTGDRWKTFQELQPRRLQKGLKSDGRAYHVFYGNGWHSHYSRVDPFDKPWSLEGWHIPIPGDWGHQKYLDFYPRTVISTDMKLKHDFFWCFNVEKDNWYLGTEGDWVIPYGCVLSHVAYMEMAVIHDW